jgi:hypothetical protein
MIELQQIAEAARNSGSPSLPLELKTDLVKGPGNDLHVQRIVVPSHTGWASVTAYYFRRLLRLHTLEQREAANLFIQAMHDAHPNTAAVDHVLRSERIKRHKPITSKQALRAYHKFVLLEETSFQFTDDGTGTNHKELKFMHGLILKLKTFFR